jgi:hypothetical protein
VGQPSEASTGRRPGTSPRIATEANNQHVVTKYKEKNMRTSIFILALAIPMFACGQSATQAASHNQHQEASNLHPSDVDARGDHAIGVSHEKSTHHFQLLADGGAIELTANDPNDKVTRDQIKNHLSHIIQMFTNGNFQIPMFIHDTVPLGVPVMKSKHASITYVFEPIPVAAALVQIAEFGRVHWSFGELRTSDEQTEQHRRVVCRAAL